ncbi:MAG: S-adenosylmethionine:tRNA ribosyltransferase-isomerase [Paludibacteraceae bacterium]|nr:S-adenosylmethionine:tRNA ribosyltransferase-isomerase [Paludibacteraceae bacterium]
MVENIKNIRIEDFNYDLPDERIAKFPLTERDSSRLLLYQKGEMEHTSFTSVATYIPSNALMVFNNTKVIHARLFFRKETGALIEVFCLEPIVPSDYQLMFQATETCTWKCMVGNLKKWKNEVLTLVCLVKGREITLQATKETLITDKQCIRFSWNNPSITFGDILEDVGTLPIPPYLHRDSQASDELTYQTVYSKEQGSVAAPTAGLHFTNKVLSDLKDKGVATAEVTLHVGAGTFLPVKSSAIGEHKMHAEVVSMDIATIELIQQSLGKIIAVGTTSVRSLESLYYIGVQLSQKKYHFAVSQWEAYEQIDGITPFQSLQEIIVHMRSNQVSILRFSTQIILAPGYQRKVVQALITNFHQPKSTLLLLIATFVGNDWKKMYEYAMNHEFRFLSYGDSSLLMP